jgi:hypothetical protein
LPKPIFLLLIVFGCIFAFFHTKNQPPRLPGSGLKCDYSRGGGGGVVFFFTYNNTTPIKLFCFVLFVGLWQ